MSDTPRTDAASFNVDITYGGLKRRIETDVVEARFARQLEQELTATRNAAVENLRELNDRLIERQESFQAQLIRIEDTWREKLKQAQLKTPYQIKLEKVTKEIEQLEKELLHKK